MKVVAFTPLYPPRSRVGAWLATHAHLRTLVERGHQVSVRVVLGAGEAYSVDGIDVAPVGWDFTPHAAGAQVVVSHAGGTNHKQIRFAANEAGAAHVVMVHGATERIPDADLAVFNSHASRRAAGYRYRKAVVCHPPLSPGDHRSVAGQRVTLVNLSPAKGGELFRLLVASMADRKFLGVRGGYGKQLRPYGPNVTTINTAQDMRDVWRQTRILLMPSIAETWGMVGVEAMCSGIPVIAHPTDGLVESLGNAGTFVDRTDIAGWRREIERLGQPDEYELASKRALRRAEEIAAVPQSFADEIEERFG